MRAGRIFRLTAEATRIARQRPPRPFLTGAVVTDALFAAGFVAAADGGAAALTGGFGRTSPSP
jgi:hypothetical protein